MRAPARPTLLGFALLGLTHQEPRSGYALRRVFETSPMGRFSSSPGSIYPALGKLEEAGLLEARQAAPSEKTLFHVTAKGRRAFLEWLATPVTAEEYRRHPDAALLRFAFLDHAGDASLTLRFLQSFERAVEEDLEQVRSFLRSEAGRTLPLHGALAVEHGIIAHEAALRWARRAMRVVAARTARLQTRLATAPPKDAGPRSAPARIGLQMSKSGSPDFEARGPHSGRKRERRP
jgi:DNA-binding PadR family transcriptional regulator